MVNEIKKEIEWNNKTLKISTGKIAKQSDGAVLVEMGDSVVLCTTVISKTETESTFLPLFINYQEKLYAAGRIPGGFLKRESKSNDKEVLVSRLIDRPIRPLIYPYFFNEIQILCTVHSYDPSCSTDILALIGASASLAISGAPYIDIVAASRVGFIDNQFVLNPSFDDIKKSRLDLIVAGTSSSVMMVESEADLLSSAEMLNAVMFGQKSIQPVIKIIKELKEEISPPELIVKELYPESLVPEVKLLIEDQVKAAFDISSKRDRVNAFNEIKQMLVDRFDSQYSEEQVNHVMSKVKAEILRAEILTREKRADKRAANEIREINCEVSLLPKAHGSALFTRGETQSLVVTTLGTSQDEQVIDGLDQEYKESFLLNYIFPAYSVGEVGALKAPSRREIGHGKLAWRALNKIIPNKEDFPYTIRVVSEITESNGSSSMATVCGASMSMMDAGIPLKSPIAGIAMGLIKEEDDIIILSDIVADEDYLGDMDFKVAGNADGISALQMDIKIAGVTFEIMEKALSQAQEGIVHILSVMNNTISKHSEISSNAPIIKSLVISKEKIKDLIGPGGKTIKEICSSTGAQIDVNDNGMVTVSAIGKENLNLAIKKVNDITIDPKIGDIMEGTVVKILEAGAFINYLGSRDGFVHISDMSHKRLESVNDLLNEGQRVKVKLIGFERGKVKFTIKDIDSKNISRSNKFLKGRHHISEDKANKLTHKDRIRKKDSTSRIDSRVSGNKGRDRKYFN